MGDGLKLGFVPANRRYFSTELAGKARDEAISAMRSLGIEVVSPDDKMTEAGLVKNRDEGIVCGELFKREGVDGIVIGAMNFGDEQGCANAVMSSSANVPIFIFGCQEDRPLAPGVPRRDSFCGLLSIAEALRQIGMKYTIARKPICFPADESFVTEMDHFARVCKVLKGIRGSRIGQIGPRPEAFWTCRYDEKMLQRIGVTAVTKDLSELLALAHKVDDAKAKAKVKDLSAASDTSGVSDEILLKIARFECAMEEMIELAKLDAVATQCWNSLQLNYGIVACGVFARLGDACIPCACESDVLGALSMYALRLATDTPSALLDWNNLHNDDPELVNLWHCGVYPPSFGAGKPKMSPQGIMSKHIGADKSTGVLELKVRPGPATVFRVTQGTDGEGWKAFIAEGQFEDNPATTFGAGGWCRLPGFERAYREILLDNFPHHIAVTRAHTGNVLHEVFGNYLAMKVYHPNQASLGAYTRALPFTFEKVQPA